MGSNDQLKVDWLKSVLVLSIEGQATERQWFSTTNVVSGQAKTVNGR